MKAKKSFTIILRTVFLLFSLYFLLDGFNRWDGYSFYMRFTDFLPELSLAFILWTVIAIILAMSLWVVMYGLFIIIPKSLMPVRLEYITAFFVLGVCAVMLLLFKGQYLSDVRLTNYINLGDGWLMIIGFLMMVGLIWFGRNHAASLLHELDGRISPLVWVFVFLLAGSAVVTIFHNKDYETKSVPGHSPHVAASDKDRPNIILGRRRDAYPVYSMYLQTNSSFAPITNGTIAVREGDLKLIYYLEDKRTMLFNTETDPDELLDLSQEKPDRTQRLVALIEDNLSRVNKKMTDAGY